MVRVKMKLASIFFFFVDYILLFIWKASNSVTNKFRVRVAFQ